MKVKPEYHRFYLWIFGRPRQIATYSSAYAIAWFSYPINDDCTDWHKCKSRYAASVSEQRPIYWLRPVMRLMSSIESAHIWLFCDFRLELHFSPFAATIRLLDFLPNTLFINVFHDIHAELSRSSFVVDWNGANGGTQNSQNCKSQHFFTFKDKNDQTTETERRKTINTISLDASRFLYRFQEQISQTWYTKIQSFFPFWEAQHHIFSHTTEVRRWWSSLNLLLSDYYYLVKIFKSSAHHFLAKADQSHFE